MEKKVIGAGAVAARAWSGVAVAAADGRGRLQGTSDGGDTVRAERLDPACAERIISGKKNWFFGFFLYSWR